MIVKPYIHVFNRALAIIFLLALTLSACGSAKPAVDVPAQQPAATIEATVFLPVSTKNHPPGSPAIVANTATTVPTSPPTASQNAPVPTIPAPGMLAPSLGGDQLSPTWSPDGQRVVFVHEDYRTSRRSLYSVDIASGILSRITNSSTSDILPQFSPDGKNILFVSQWFGAGPSPKTTIMVLNTDSGVVNQISDGVDYIIEAAWSPNGSQIAFVATHGGRDRLWKMNSDGSGTHPLTPSLDTLRSLAWSPNGLYIEFNKIEINQAGDSAVELHVINVENETDQRLTITAEQPIQAAWSRDSQKLYYLSQLKQSLFSVALADMKQETVLTFPSAVNDYSISPDGARIAYSMNDVSNSEVINLYVSGIDGSDPRCYPHPGMSDIFAVWSPDGKWLVFESYVPHTGPVPLYIIRVNDLTPCASQAAN